MSKENPRTPQQIINQITDSLEKKGGDFIYRGVNEIFYKDGEKRVISSLYEKYRKEKIWNKHFMPYQIEKEFVEKARRHFQHQTSNIEILTDLRHLGAEVNLIDFTYNLNIALFFTCNGEFEKSGELIYLSTEGVDKMKNINYTSIVDGIIEPARTNNSEKRVISQASVFVYAANGYLSKIEWDWESFEIHHSEKEPLLSYLNKVYNISENIIYNDLAGFIANKKNYESASIQYYQATSLQKQGQHEKAIEKLNKVIKTNPLFMNPYCAKAISEMALRKFENAIKDCDKAIIINPSYVFAYYEVRSF